MSTQLQKPSPASPGTPLPRRFGSKRHAAAFASVSTRTVDNWIAEGLPHCKVSPRMVRIDLDELAAWLKEHYGVRRRSPLR